MALNIITIEFEACTPAPADGYQISYRPIGSEIDYRIVNVLGSPAVIEDDNDEECTSYEGFIQGDCGGGILGSPVYFEAPNLIRCDESGSVSGSGPLPLPQFRYLCEVYSCSNCSEPMGTTICQSTNPSLILFKYYQANIGGDVVYRPISTSIGVASDDIIGLPWDTCILACAAPPPIDPD